MTSIKPNKMAKKIEFNKETAINELGEILQGLNNCTISETIKILENAQNFLQEIHDNAFNEGFEKGIDATKKLDQI